MRCPPLAATPLNLLAVETSTELCSVAILRGGELFVEEALAQNRHSEMLVPIRKEMPWPQAALVGCCVPTGVGAVTRVSTWLAPLPGAS